MTKLVENYRSHPALVQLPSQLFYNDELVVSAEKSLVECLCAWDQLPNRTGFPVLFHGVRVRDSFLAGKCVNHCLLLYSGRCFPGQLTP